MKYNERTCITAEELRAAGYPVPDKVPDAGWIPRTALQWIGLGNCTFDRKTGRISTMIQVAFTEPFRWRELEA